MGIILGKVLFPVIALFSNYWSYLPSCELYNVKLNGGQCTDQYKDERILRFYCLKIMTGVWSDKTVKNTLIIIQRVLIWRRLYWSFSSTSTRETETREMTKKRKKKEKVKKKNEEEKMNIR